MTFYSRWGTSGSSTTVWPIWGFDGNRWRIYLYPAEPPEKWKDPPAVVQVNVSSYEILPMRWNVKAVTAQNMNLFCREGKRDMLLGEYTSLAGKEARIPVVIEAYHEGNLECVAKAQNNSNIKPTVSNVHYLRVVGGSFIYIYSTLQVWKWFPFNSKPEPAGCDVCLKCTAVQTS